MYNFIIHPITKDHLSINSNAGKTLLKRFILACQSTLIPNQQGGYFPLTMKLRHFNINIRREGKTLSVKLQDPSNKASPEKDLFSEPLTDNIDDIVKKVKRTLCDVWTKHSREHSQRLSRKTLFNGESNNAGTVKVKYFDIPQRYTVIAKLIKLPIRLRDVELLNWSVLPSEIIKYVKQYNTEHILSIVLENETFPIQEMSRLQMGNQLENEGLKFSWYTQTLLEWIPFYERARSYEDFFLHAKTIEHADDSFDRLSLEQVIKELEALEALEALPDKEKQAPENMKNLHNIYPWLLPTTEPSKANKDPYYLLAHKTIQEHLSLFQGRAEQNLTPAQIQTYKKNVTHAQKAVIQYIQTHINNDMVNTSDLLIVSRIFNSLLEHNNQKMYKGFYQFLNTTESFKYHWDTNQSSEFKWKTWEELVKL